MRCYFLIISTKMAIIIKQKIACIGKDRRNWNPHTVVENAKCCSWRGKQFGSYSRS